MGPSAWGKSSMIVVAGVLLGARPARADLVYELQPTVAVGVTDNATNAAPPSPRLSEEFGTVGGTARARLVSLHANHSLGYRLSGTSYLHNRGTTTLTQDLAWLSDFTPTAKLALRLGVSGGYGRTSNPVGLDVNRGPTLSPQLGQDTAILSSTATEEVRYQTGARTYLLQNLHASGIRYFLPPGVETNVAGQPPITSSYTFGALLRGEHELGWNLLTLQLDVSDTKVPGRGATPGLPDEVLSVEALAGWRRDLSLTSFAELQAGALEISDFHGTTVLEPAGVGTLGYRRLEWYASLTASQSATANIFIGAVTLTDQVSARLALPLSKSQLYYVLGNGGYTYARFVDQAGSRRAYELRSAGVSFTAHARSLPIWASLDYTISSQLGTEGAGGVIPDVRRQVVMLTFGGAFVHGPGAPPVFHGVLPAVLPLGEKGTEPADKASGNAEAPDKPSGNVDNVTR